MPRVYTPEELRDLYQNGAKAEMEQEVAPVMGRGVIVQVKFPHGPSPKEAVFWWPVGNCHACRNFRHPWMGDMASEQCLAGVTNWQLQLSRNDCPKWAAGMDEGSAPAESADEDEQDMWLQRLDAYQAAKLAPGEPSQPVEVRAVVPWSPWVEMQARNTVAHLMNVAYAVAMGHDFSEPEDKHPDEPLPLIEAGEPK